MIDIKPELLEVWDTGYTEEDREIQQLVANSDGEYVYAPVSGTAITDENRDLLEKLGAITSDGVAIGDRMADFGITNPGKVIVGHLDEMIEEALIRKQQRQPQP